MEEPVTIFLCSAREDEALLNKLKTHLMPLQRQNLIDVWHDRDISAGAEWEQEINEHLNAAQIILLLVSPDFMHSDYCYGIEMKRALERHEKGEAVVIPVIGRPTYWKIAPFSHLHVLPTDGKPLTDQHWHTVDDAFLNVIEGIRGAIATFSQPAQKGASWAPESLTTPQSPLVATSKILDVDYILTAGQDRRPTLVPASGHIVRLTIEATDSRTTILQSLRPVIHSRSEATGSLSPHFGIVTPRPFEVLLDENPPCLKPIDPKGPKFPFKVGPSDPEVFELKVLTATGDVKWWLELDWTSVGREGTLRVDLGGSPFRTMARPSQEKEEIADVKRI